MCCRSLFNVSNTASLEEGIGLHTIPFAMVALKRRKEEKMGRLCKSKIEIDFD